MLLFALEINDAGLVLAREHEEGVRIVAEQPGIAIVEQGGVVTGVQAAQRMRLKPLGVQHDYWRLLGTDSLPRTGTPGLSAADLAFAQLEELLAAHKQEISGLLLAVPPGYSREQLGLLLGVTDEIRVPLVGLADSTLAAAAADTVPPRVLHLDLQLHQALLAVLERDGTELQRTRFELLPRHGWLALQQAWVRLLSDTFILRTRFDPLHQAATEQLLVDRLPEWLAAACVAPSVEAKIPFDGQEYGIEIDSQAFVAAATPVYDEFVRLVKAVRPAGMQVELQLTHRMAELPGLKERLKELRDCSLRVLPLGCAAMGALRHASSIARPADSRVLVYRLPRVQPADPPVAVGDAPATPPGLRPTHLLFGNRAWAISAEPLTLGWSVAAPRGLQLPPSVPGLSRSHCTVARSNGAVIVRDHSTYGSFVNNERVHGEAILNVGDRLRLGTPGVTLDLIQLVQDDGSPQD